MFRSREEERVMRTIMVHSRMLTEDFVDCCKQDLGAQIEKTGTTLERRDGAEADLSEQLPDFSLELHKWKSERDSPEELSWRQALSEVDGDLFPTHLRPFSCPEQYRLVKQTYQQLQHSGYYWGALTMEEAPCHAVPRSPGTFLIRDSVQPDVFFTLSYRSEDGPTSVRVLLNKDLHFSLHGSHKTFPSLFALLTTTPGPPANCPARTGNSVPNG
ncbi:hypothetical protein WMY93_005980 [Mugilogobius chulae]|uniref:SH2 domain-containing protein n=1 Tax=Mugilogobius chulae TaxID=88201 RepID=A0AAW0PIT6_9GOBI